MTSRFMRKNRTPVSWLRNGIPQFRLPQSVLDTIARIEKMGVTIKCNNEVGNTLTLEQLKAENHAYGHRGVIRRYRATAV